MKWKTVFEVERNEMMKIILIVAVILFVLSMVTEIGVSLFINQGREKEVKVRKDSHFVKKLQRFFQRKEKIQEQS